MQVRFVIVAPASQRRSIPVRLPILVGRSEEAKFRIQQDSVSRRHCEFFAEGGTVFVRDLGSTNGTRLDSRDVATDVATPVPSGTTVWVGGVAFRVEYETTDGPMAAHAAGDDTVPLVDERPSRAAEPPPPADAEDAIVGASPEDAALAAAPDDENLNEFFKSLS